MSVISNNILAGASGQAGGAAPAGYQIERSLRFNSADSAYLNRTPSSAGNRKTWTWSGWVKKSGGSGFEPFFSANTTTWLDIAFNSDKLRCIFNAGAGEIGAISDAVFRDPSSWYHIVVAVDTTESTAADRIKFYVNGASISHVAGSNGYPSQNYDTLVNSATIHRFGADGRSSIRYGSNYLADVHFIDGQALAPTDFGEYDDNGVWQPIEYVASGPNDGTTWSNNWSASGNGFASGAGPTELFDGDSSNYLNNAAGGQIITWNTSSYTLGGHLKILCYSSSAVYDIYVNGSKAADTGSSLALIDCGTVSNINEIQFAGTTYNTTDGLGSSGIYVYEIFVDGVPLLDGDTSNIGVNGFHLDFSDNSSNAALGTDSSDNSNTWTVNNLVADGGVVYSNYVSGYLNSLTDTATYPVTNLFDGSTSTIVFSSNISGSGIKFVPTIDITGSIELYLRNGDTANSTFSYSLDNGSTFTNLTTTSAGGYVSIGSQTIGNVNGIIVRHVTTDGTNSVNWRAIKVDGTVLTDGTPSNTDSLFDSPTNGIQTDTGLGGEVSGNYATWNPLISSTNLTNGNLSVVQPGTTATSRYSTLGMSSGKWYWEITVVNYSNTVFGIRTPGGGILETPYDSSGYGMGWRNSGGFYIGGSNTGTGSMSLAAGDTLGLAFDADVGTLKFYKNGTLNNTLTASSAYVGQTWFAGSQDSGGGNSDHNVNFGQRAFAYTAPSGFKALCTANLSDPTIADGSTAMDVALYTGNGSTQSISGLSMSPDLVWIKQRNAASDHNLFDIVRGVQKRLFSNSTAAEGTISTGLTAFNSDGWTMGSSGNINGNNNTYVGWTWDAGTSTVSNTDGSITSQVRANPSAGFSIVSYTGNGSAGATVGHGLSAVPSMIIVKNRDIGTDGNWAVRHSATGSSYLLLNLTNAANSNTAVWTSTSPTSSVFSIGTSPAVNGNGNDLIAYCFAPVEGYSAFGSYEGNGSTDGPFIYTGFRPKFILWKKTNTATNAPWVIADTARSTYNLVRDYLLPNTSDAEASVDLIDVLSNGYKWRGNAPGGNNNGDTYIYAAFAENPFKTARAR